MAVSNAAKKRMCGKKRRFRKQHEAEWAARMIKANAGERMHAYPCPVCKGWHIGH